MLPTIQSEAVAAPAPISRKLARQLAGIEVAKRRGTKPGARELFAFLRPKLLASRPVVKEAVFEKRTVLVNGKGRNRNVEVKPPVYGMPTFRNVYDPETGALV